MAYYCPTCEPDYQAAPGAPVASVAYCEPHSGRAPCPHCPALPGDRHYLGCPLREPLSPEPPENPAELKRWLDRRLRGGERPAS